ncbi:MAG: MFS transporter [Gemmatimonadetes bacterium]|nr:MFS transporter [Gemmatimonadota bacterium]
MSRANPLDSKLGRIITFSLLYMSEGIPFGFSAIALVTYLRQSGVGLAEIGFFTAWLYGPWSFKWAWAPLVDLIQPKLLGPRKFWIASAQVMMIVTLGVVLAVDPGTNLVLLTLLIAIHNVFAATQDVAIDALAVSVLPEHERGTANGFMFGSSYLGQAIGGSGALYVAGAFGFNWSYALVLGALAIILVAVTLRIQEPVYEAVEAAAQRTGSVISVFLSRLKAFLKDLYTGLFKSGRGPALGVLFALLPPGTVALGLALGATMQVDIGMDENAIANLTLMTTVAAALGCVVGGWVSDRFGHRRMLAVWYILTGFPTFWLAQKLVGNGMEGVTITEFFVVAVIYNFTSGLVAGTNLALFMGLTNPKVAATQFTGYMAMRNVVYAYSATWQGQAAEANGYAWVLMIEIGLLALPLILLPFLSPLRPVQVAEPAPVID